MDKNKKEIKIIYLLPYHTRHHQPSDWKSCHSNVHCVEQGLVLPVPGPPVLERLEHLPLKLERHL